MSNESHGDWVKSNTPHDENWDEEQSEYGLAVEPEEWDDYANDQSVPVATPQPRRDDELKRSLSPEERDEVAFPATSQDDVAHAETAELNQPSPTPMGVEDSAVAEPTAEAPSYSFGAVDGVSQSEEQDLAATEPMSAEPVDEHATATPSSPVELSKDTQSGDVREAELRDESVSFDEPRDEPIRQEDHHDEQPTSDWALVASNPHDVEKQPNPYQSGWLDDREDAESPRPVVDEESEPGEDPVPYVPAQEPEAEPEDEAVDDPVTELADEPREELAEESVDPELTQPFAAVEEPTAEPRHEVSPLSETADAESGETAAVADDDSEATRAIPVAAAATTGLYRDEDHTAVLDNERLIAEQEEQERRFQEQLAAEHSARQQRLGVVQTSSENEVREANVNPHPTTDKFFPSLGLLLLRLVTAGIVGITAYQILTDVAGAEQVLATTLLPEPRLMAWIIGFTLGGMAIFLVLGVLNRLVGLLLLVYGIGMLALLKWGPFNPFLERFEGFMGDKELLLAAVGMVLLTIGGGRVALDAAVRRSRVKARMERYS